MEKLETSRLQLIATTVENVTADLEDYAELGRLLDARVPDNWPPPLADDDSKRWTLKYLKADPRHQAWPGWYIVHKDTRELIGQAGYKGPPDEDGTVEIGYGLMEEHHRQGYAPEAAAALIERAFADPNVKRVIAETLPELRASQRVLEKAGFSFIGEGSEPGVIRYELTRQTYLGGSKAL